MSTIITTVADLYALCDDMLGDHRLPRERCMEIAEQVSHEAHIDGLRYGEDWSDWLGTISPATLWDYARGLRDDMTGDGSSPPKRGRPDGRRSNTLTRRSDNDRSMQGGGNPVL